MCVEFEMTGHSLYRRLILLYDVGDSKYALRIELTIKSRSIGQHNGLPIEQTRDLSRTG
jgi:hypothetical protein